MSINIEMNMKGADGTYEALYPRTLGALVEGKVSSATNADTAVSAQTSESASTATNATTATSAGKLTTARNLRVSLSSTSTQSFDGSANATSIGVNGTLGVSNGGTGVTSYSSLATQLNSYLSSSVDLTTSSISIFYTGDGNSTSIRRIQLSDANPYYNKFLFSNITTINGTSVTYNSITAVPVAFLFGNTSTLNVALSLKIPSGDINGLWTGQVAIMVQNNSVILQCTGAYNINGQEYWVTVITCK